MSNWLCGIFNFCVGAGGAALTVVTATGGGAPFFPLFVTGGGIGVAPTSSIRTGM